MLIVLAAPVAARADDSLATARELYAAAAYEDALAMLDRLRTPADVPDLGRTIAQYRAFCLFALGRTAEAEHAIETVVATEPSFQPTDADASPRVRAAFGDVRRRVLPGIIQQKYGLAKAAFDRKEFAAADGFKVVAEMLDDPDVRDASKTPPLSDLRTLAAGFRELSVTAAAPPPSPPLAPPLRPLPSRRRSRYRERLVSTAPTMGSSWRRPLCGRPCRPFVSSRQLSAISPWPSASTSVAPSKASTWSPCWIPNSTGWSRTRRGPRSRPRLDAAASGTPEFVDQFEPALTAATTPSRALLAAERRQRIHARHAGSRWLRSVDHQHHDGRGTAPRDRPATRRTEGQPRAAPGRGRMLNRRRCRRRPRRSPLTQEQPCHVGPRGAERIKANPDLVPAPADPNATTPYTPMAESNSAGRERGHDDRADGRGSHRLVDNVFERADVRDAQLAIDRQQFARQRSE